MIPTLLSSDKQRHSKSRFLRGRRSTEATKPFKKHDKMSTTLIGWALLPIALILIGFLFVAIQVIRGASTDVAPFIYALF